MNSDPLYGAVKDGNLDRVKNLFERPQAIKINKLHDDIETVLAAAVRLRHTKIVQFLTDKGADVNIKTYSGKTPLHLASFEGDLDITNILVRHGAKIDIVDETGKNPLHWAVKQNRADITNALLGHGGDVNAQSDSGDTILHEAISNAQKDVIECLIEGGADVKRTNADGDTPLHVAALHGRHTIAEMLLRHGADINALNKSGESVLHICSIKGHVKMVAYLLATLQVDEEYINKQTVGGRAMFQGKTRIIEGWTALHLACAAGQVNAAKLLLDHKADKTIQTKDGKTAKDLAVFYKKEKVVSLFDEEVPPKGRRASMPVIAVKSTVPDKRRGSMANQSTGMWKK